MQVLTAANAPAIGARVRVTDYLGRVHEGEVTSRDWFFQEIHSFKIDALADGFCGPWVTIHGGRDSFELV